MVDDDAEAPRLFDLEPVLFTKLEKLGTRSIIERRRAFTRLMKMHTRYGAGAPGLTCGRCAHLIRGGGADGRFLKCRLYGDTRSTASDWRKRWPACGHYEPRRPATGG